uniref:Uncharacterized protein n=1 Tax=Meloidogyne enterolobii TaxID=390850 RepID=A0A6V7ULJ4_MELEN|nr:unnamed protein product [Meloidogyne enterolobii]
MPKTDFLHPKTILNFNILLGIAGLRFEIWHLMLFISKVRFKHLFFNGSFLIKY